MYKYYLLPDAKKDLDKVSKREKINALDSIERLINGLWGGGTRVKKLHVLLGENVFMKQERIVARDFYLLLVKRKKVQTLHCIYIMYV